jgi:hypothetical protein
MEEVEVDGAWYVVETRNEYMSLVGKADGR